MLPFTFWQTCQLSQLQIEVVCANIVLTLTAAFKTFCNFVCVIRDMVAFTIMSTFLASAPHVSSISQLTTCNPNQWLLST